ncbi:MAG: CBS domain-containing protein [bacterium]
MRNHIAHGFKLDGKHYAIPSYHALDELNKMKDAIMKPVTCGVAFKKEVFTCSTTDTLKEVMTSMKNLGYTHIPVYDENKVFKGVLTQSAICEWLAAHMQLGQQQALDTVTIGSVDLNAGHERYDMISQDTALFTISPLFEKIGLNKKRLGCLVITEHGDVKEPFLGLITSFDLPHIADYNFIV